MCPSCGGRGVMVAIQGVSLSCKVCGGTGVATPEDLVRVACGAAIKEQRLGQRITLFDYSRALGITPAALSAMEAGARTAYQTPSVPDDIRAAGWMVVMHNDFRHEEVNYTLWMFAKDGRVVRGEGPNDFIALQEVRERIAALDLEVVETQL